MQKWFVAIVCSLCLLCSTISFAEPKEDRGAHLIKLVKKDVSRPLRDMAPAPRAAGVKKIRPNPPLPLTDQDRVIGVDRVEQTSALSSPLAPTSSGHFEGIGEGLAGYNAVWVPPDTNGDVGPTRYVQTVNTDLAVFDKSGNVVLGPVGINTLWSGFGGDCQTYNDGDPTVVYDQFADRWIIAQFTATVTPYYQCVAVSTSGDPTGSYNRYAYSFGTAFPDYPKMAVWPSANAYFITFNMFAPSFTGANVCAFQRDKLLAGQANTMQCKMTSSSFGGLLAADLDGTAQPAAGTDEYLVGRSGTTLNAWRFHVDWTTPANTSMTGPLAISGVASYSLPTCQGGSLSCVTQPGTNKKLDTLGDRVMNRFAYRKLTGHDAGVVSHSVNASSGVIGSRWYELRPSGNTLSVFQQGTFSPDTTHRWMPSIAMDQAGNIAMGYSVSSSSVNPGIRYTGRLATDAVGQMQTEATIINGTGSQTQYSRWGDYASIQADPTDDCTFWFTTEYEAATGSFNWHTRIASFKFPTCGGGGGNTPPNASFTFSCTGLSCNFTDTSSDPDGNIASRSWTFGDGGTSTAQNPSHTYAAGGTYSVGLTVTDNGGAQGNTSQNVGVSGGGSGITLSASGFKVRGVNNANLSWSGAAGANVDVYRNNVLIITTANDGAHSDNIGTKGSGTFTYRVCEAGTSTCSNDAVVVF